MQRPMSDASSSSPLGFVRIFTDFAVHRDDYDPSVPRYRRAQRGDGGCLVRKFVDGLSPAGSARSLRRQPDGKVLVTDGPYTETKEGGWPTLSVLILRLGSKNRGAPSFPGFCERVGGPFGPLDFSPSTWPIPER